MRNNKQDARVCVVGSANILYKIEPLVYVMYGPLVFTLMPH